MGALANEFRRALETRVLVLDGATGTELTRRGVETTLPLWSTSALLDHPDVVEAIHRDYVQAGVDIIVANTFRTNMRTLERAGLYDQGEQLNKKAIELARNAIAGAKTTPLPLREGQGEGRPIDKSDPRENESNLQSKNQDPPVVPPKRGDGQSPLVAASLAPVEDCYRPDLTPDPATLLDEHTQTIQWLAAAKPDLIWIETMNNAREASAAATAAWARALPFVISFVVNENGALLSGEPLSQAIEAVEAFNPLAIGLNCIPPEGMTRNLPILRNLTDRPLIAYAHISNPEPIRGWSFSQSVSPAEYAEHARRWIDLGARIVGGCCGTTPAHIRAVREAIGS